ncbi:alpha-mannosidase [Tsukamurella pulmonis]|uniref:Alpha-mannosidase n=1 Tax=Tsukamurella pulmonis TaxID=47312 RepID=A0A1H1G916_9ACTN|nr:glycoside hydrolase family 38 C-terminal domain-containing protein [Tsukamurella pulmonis]KXO87887.1 alpha-mannosidase [Tsukamurella pulmonis]SDR09569.1 alpha-mannosidase [Tsukamurella pulmonis]SUP17667.1 Mannosylglycerate hydrolase [Tsukamurella pulmonis]
MHDDRRLTEERLDRFTREFLNRAVYSHTAPVTVTAWAAPGEPVPFEEAVAQDFEPIAPGTPWGAPWSTLWLHVTGAAPSDWSRLVEPDRAVHAPELRVELGFTGGPGFNAEGLVYRTDGTVAKGISPFNAYVPLTPGEPVDLYIECAANPDLGGDFVSPTHLGDRETAGDAPLYRLGTIDLALRDLTVWELQQDVWTLNGLMHELPFDLPRRHEVLRALERMLDVVDPHDVAGTAAQGRAALAPALASPASASAHRITAVGHAHIDSAWLWPVRETARKCARTFANVVDLMDRDPSLTFACSSAQQFAWVKDRNPELFARIKDHVAAGRFVPVGGMWVEADTNMPGGEAMARQFVAGKRFFLHEFGIDTPEAWLPDSFGYSAAMPQIVAAAGSRYFLTQKLSWNQTNRMPHSSFLWEGIDGTALFTHFPPVDKYNSDLSGADLARAQKNYREQGHGTRSLVPFGWGDGGGGPTREMLAAAARAASLEGSPTVEIASPAEFFDAAAAELTHPARWVGELYLEFHRGTYTSQANTKQGNRRSEHLLREAELWATTAAVRTGFGYPAQELEEIWHLVLLQQFHDILPGSSIAWVHKDAEHNYAAVARRLERIIDGALASLADAAPGTGEAASPSRRLVFNAAPHPRDGVPALAAAVVAAAAPVPPVVEDSGFRLDNGVVSALVDARGLLVSLVDAATGREAMAEPGNLLQLHRDIPNHWEAWDIDSFYRRDVTDLVEADSVTVDGDAVEVRRSVGESTITQRISLLADSPALDIVTEIDWHERQKLLKLAFPFDVQADRSASEIQFGHVFRPTHSNTSWDAAKFETCAHRWVHVGEPDYGVAVANDSTYGHDITALTADSGTANATVSSGTAVRLSLLRAPRYPDPEADQGRHRLAVSVRPAATIGDAVEEGYRRNLALRSVSGAAEVVAPLVAVDHPGVIVEAVKLAEDGSGDVVVRLYESRGTRATATVHADFRHTAAVRTDLLERPVAEPEPAADVRLSLRPFQIVTLRFRR